MKFVGYNGKWVPNNKKMVPVENIDNVDNAEIDLGGKDSGIVFVCIYDNKDLVGKILEKYPSNLIVESAGGLALFYKVNQDVDSFPAHNINIGIKAFCGNKLFPIKEDGVKNKHTGELSFDNLTSLPDILLPLENVHIKRLDNVTNDERNSSLLNHLTDVKNYYYHVDLLEIAYFINNNVFPEPLEQSEVEALVTRVNWDSKANRGYKSMDEYKTGYKKWLWYPYVPLGTVTLMAGDPGCGKSQTSLQIASIVSRGDNFPFADSVNVKNSVTSPSAVIMQNGEDSIEDDVKPRLINLKANLSKIFIIQEEKELFTLDNLDKLEEVLKRERAKVVILDPLQRYIGDVNLNSMTDVTNCLKNLTILAQKYECAIIIIMHLNKSQTKDLYSIGGSIGIVGNARSVLVVKDLEENDEKVILSIKSSGTKRGLPIVFEITDNGVVFKEQRTLDELKFKNEKEPKPSKRDDATSFIIEQLCSGEIESLVVLENASKKNISSSTLNRAKEKLGIESFQRDRKWYWKLPEDNDLADSHYSDNENVESDNEKKLIESEENLNEK